MKELGREIVPKTPIPFRWRYMALPTAVFLLSIIITIYFYHLLPDEVAYHFKDGSPDKWMDRGAVIAWMLIPQFIFTLLAGAIAWGITKLSTRFQPTASHWIENIILIMGNMVALPQIILSFAMLDIFSYNAYKIHLISLWVFALIVMALGGIILVTFFTLAIRRFQRTAKGDA
ncbi:DUF1648 domain-containing protein [Chloroflexota bacterium]